MKKTAFALTTCILVLLVCSVPGAFAKVALQTPTTVEASQPASFSVSAADSTQVAFSVDGKTRWTERPQGREFRRAGAVALSTGRHVLSVSASNAKGKVTTTSHTVTVRKPSRGRTSSTSTSTSSGGSTSTSGSSSSGSTSTGSTGSSGSTSTGSSGSTGGTTTTTPVVPPAEETTSSTGSTGIEGTGSTSEFGTMLFDSSRISSFYLNQSAAGAVTEIADPAGSGESVYQMTVKNTDVYPITPTENPRAELVSQPMFHSGSEFWASSKFYLPENGFPSSVPGWLTLMEGPYGEPFAGTPPWHLEVSGTSIQWSRNGTYNWDVPWKMPLIRNSWVTVTLHEKFATEGWVEMWINGQQINFFSSGGYNPSHVAPTTKLPCRPWMPRPTRAPALFT